MPSLDFFIGKGGVGKTTVSAAYAVSLAAQRSGRTLVLSTDPAHSLADIFELRSQRERQRLRISRNSSLDVWQLDAAREFGEFLDHYRGAVLDVIASGTIFSREEIAPLLDTTVPGMAEVSALLVLADLLSARDYKNIVVDTAPLGHTLRLFELPDSFLKLLRFLEVAAGRDQLLARRFAGAAVAGPAFFKEWQARAAAIRDALSGPDSRLVLVTTPEDFALNESARAKNALAAAGLHVTSIVLNRAVANGDECPRCSARARRTTAARAFLRRHFPNTELNVGDDIGAPISGLHALRTFGDHVFLGRELKLSIKPPKPPKLRLRRTKWPALDTPLSLTIGKGGVGKTTISAALSYVTRERDDSPLTICSIDPAPSLDDVFRQRVGDRPVAVLRDRDLRALEMDAAAAFQSWTSHLKDKLDGAFSGGSGNIHLDLTFERDVITALLDMVPPGMDELAATFRILGLLAEDQKVVIDMAPTGHALELLRMPDRIHLWTRLLLRALAPHRALRLAQEAAVEIAKIGHDVRELAATLHDQDRSCVYPVMLAEPLPDRETSRLIADLGALNVSLGPLFVNRLLFQRDSGCERCDRAAAFQVATLARLRGGKFDTLFAVPEQPAPVAGSAALKKFTRDLWRIE